MTGDADVAALDRDWFARPAPVVAPDLLNKLLVTSIDGRRTAGRIIEVEAYMQDDPASHTYRGRTNRNAIMFGPAGHLYVYLSYGIHRCANVVTGVSGRGEAVLLRALDPVAGIEVMRERRSGVPDRRLTDGPGKLCQALGVGLDHDGSDLFDCADVVIIDDGHRPPTAPITGPRVGIAKAVDVPWRFRSPPAS